MSITQLQQEFKTRYDLEKYTREYLSTHFETVVKKGDVVPKDYTYKKISDLTDSELRNILLHYKNKVNERPTPKTQIATIQQYYDNNKLNVHHTFDKIGGSDEDWWLWGFFFTILIIILIFLYRRKQSS